MMQSLVFLGVYRFQQRRKSYSDFTFSLILGFFPRQTGNLWQLWVDRMDTNHWMPQRGWVTWR